MKARRKSPVRNLLRFFEIALFFAISVLGYGLLAKTATSGSKTKSRALSTSIEKGGFTYGLQRELREFTVLARLRMLSPASGDELPTPGLQAAAHPAATALHSHQRNAPPSSFCTASATNLLFLPHPCNLLQQNPVLLT